MNSKAYRCDRQRIDEFLKSDQIQIKAKGVKEVLLLAPERVGPRS